MVAALGGRSARSENVTGGTGGRLRWPNRHPHRLANWIWSIQSSLAGFLPLIGWSRVRRRNLNEEIGIGVPSVTSPADSQSSGRLVPPDGCAGPERAGASGRSPGVAGRLSLPDLQTGRYAVTAWDTEAGLLRGSDIVIANACAGMQVVLSPLIRDVALAIRRV